MSHARWLAIVLHERLAWQGVVGLALMGAWILMNMLQIHPLEQKSDRLRSAATAGRGPHAMVDARNELEAFRASLRRGDLEDQLKELNESGKTAGLPFKRIEYRMLEERRSGLKQYQITMPVTGSYPVIRRFTSLALATMPGLSLDHVHFQRRKIGESAIDAELRFTLFLADPV
jgi:Tfp pilus assembly protein PilO